MECTLGSIFRRHFAGYAQRHRQPLYIHRAAYWLANCRTQAMGGHLNRCPEGHVEHASYNSCHQRYCPQCQGLATERWLQAQKARLLACALGFRHPSYAGGEYQSGIQQRMGPDPPRGIG